MNGIPGASASLRRLCMWLVAGFLFISATRSALAQEGPNIKWTKGPATVPLGSNANLKLPAGYQFADADGTRAFLEANQNLYDGELGLLVPEDISDKDAWFVLFSFEDIGYVKDDEKLDRKAIDGTLESFRKGNEQGNQEKIRRGWETLTIEGWSKEPFYDSVTHGLTWGILVSSKSGKSVNYDARVLGRYGVMKVKMVLAPEMVAATVPKFQNIVLAVGFTQGATYAEYRTGDKIAKYGLVGLMTGVGAVAAIKFWKPLVAFGAMIIAGIGAIFKKIKNAITGKRA